MQWMRRGLHCIYFVLCLFPIALLITRAIPIYPMPVMLLFGISLVVLTFALAGFVPHRHRIVGIAILVPLAILSLLFMPFGKWNLLFVLILFVYTILALSLAQTLTKQEMTFAQMAVGAIVYLFVYVFAFLNGIKSIAQPLSIMLGVYLVYTIVLLNVASTKEVTGNTSVSTHMRRGNLLTTIGFVVLTLLLVNIGALKDGFLSGLGALTRTILAIITFFSGTQDTTQGASPQGTGDLSMLPIETGTPLPAWLDALLQGLRVAITYALLLAIFLAICFALYKLVKKIAALLKVWFHTSTSDDPLYQEEKVSLLDFQSIRPSLRHVFSNAMRRITYKKPKWEQLDNRARVRLAFSSLLFSSGKQRTLGGATAKEWLTSQPERTLPDASAFYKAYDLARYSHEEIDDQAADIAYRIYRSGAKK